MKWGVLDVLLFAISVTIVMISVGFLISCLTSIFYKKKEKDDDLESGTDKNGGDK